MRMESSQTHPLLAFRQSFEGVFRTLDWLPPLLARVSLGMMFAAAGWGKVNHIDGFTGFLASLGIPFAAANAYVVAYSELICGGLLLVGLATRLATLPLMITMIVALSTAKAAQVTSVVALFGMAEFAFLALLVYVALGGPGRFSMDSGVVDMLRERKKEHGTHVPPHGAVAGSS